MATEDKLLNGSGLSHLASVIKAYVLEHAGGLPTYPTTDGNYFLRCAVEDEVATCSWAEEPESASGQLF